MAQMALFIASLVVLKCNQQQKEIEILKEVLSKYINAEDQERLKLATTPKTPDRAKKIKLLIVLILLLIAPYLIIFFSR